MKLASRLAAAILIATLRSAGAPAASVGTDVSYGSTIVDADGVSRAVSFEGTAEGPTLTGTLTVDASVQKVTATIAKDGSISGQLSGSDGQRSGVFWGQRSGSHIKGNFDVNGHVGEWSVPASKLPVPK